MGDSDEDKKEIKLPDISDPGASSEHPCKRVKVKLGKRPAECPAEYPADDFGKRAAESEKLKTDERTAQIRPQGASGYEGDEESGSGYEESDGDEESGSGYEGDEESGNGNDGDEESGSGNEGDEESGNGNEGVEESESGDESKKLKMVKRQFSEKHLLRQKAIKKSGSYRTAAQIRPQGASVIKPDEEDEEEYGKGDEEESGNGHEDSENESENGHEEPENESENGDESKKLTVERQFSEKHLLRQKAIKESNRTARTAQIRPQGAALIKPENEDDKEESENEQVNGEPDVLPIQINLQRSHANEEEAEIEAPITQIEARRISANLAVPFVIFDRALNTPHTMMVHSRNAGGAGSTTADQSTCHFLGGTGLQEFMLNHNLQQGSIIRIDRDAGGMFITTPAPV